MGALLASVPAMILAGGLGTRLRSVYADGPKTMAPVAGRPFLEYLLRDLKCAGILRVILCTGYKSSMIADWLGNGASFGLEVEYSAEPQPLGTGGAVRHAACSVSGTDAFFLLNGDSLLQTDYESMYKHHFATGAAITMGVCRVDDVARYGSVDMADDGRILGFNEKAINSAPRPGYINGGVYVVRTSILESMPQGVLSLEREVFPVFMDKGIYGFKTAGGYFIDIGVPADYERAQVMLGNRLGKE